MSHKGLVVDEKELRAQLVSLLRGEHSHMSAKDALANFPEDDYNLKPPNVEYSFWQLLEHIRITQADVLDFMKNSKYKYLDWPADYWPKPEVGAREKDWEKTVNGFFADLEELEQMALDHNVPLFDKIPHGEGQTYYREFVVVGNHNSYHLGEFAILRQVVGNWGAKKRG